MLKEVQQTLLLISSPLCGIACLICFIKLMTSPDDKTAQICKETLKRIFIAWAALNGVLLIANAAISLAGGDSTIYVMTA